MNVSLNSKDPVALTQALIQCPSVTPEEGGALRLLDALLKERGFEVTSCVSQMKTRPILIIFMHALALKRLVLFLQATQMLYPQAMKRTGRKRHFPARLSTEFFMAVVPQI